MAYVSTGPVSTMPGHTSIPPAGTMCDDHPTRPAVRRVQGETDSFGCESNDWCQECLDAFNAVFHEQKDGYCEWHNGPGTDIRNFRDYDEGSSGRLYMTCRECRIKSNEDAQAELDYLNSSNYDGGWL